MISNNHTFSKGNLTILQVDDKSLKLNYLEEFEINKAIKNKTTLMTAIQYIRNSPLLTPK